MKQNQKGVLELIVLIVLIVVGVGAFIIYQVSVSEDEYTEPSASTTKAQVNTDDSQQATTRPEAAIDKSDYFEIKAQEVRFLSSLMDDTSLVESDGFYKDDPVSAYSIGSREFTQKVIEQTGSPANGLQYCQDLVTVVKYQRSSDADLEDEDIEGSIQLNNGFYAFYRPRVKCFPFDPEDPGRFDQIEQESEDLIEQIVDDLQTLEVIE